MKNEILCLVIAIALTSGCVRGSTRRATPPAPASPPATLVLEMFNDLGGDWSTEYLQVYADGWLLWQGKPQNGRAVRLGQETLKGAGEQEIHVRALGLRSKKSGGHMASTRKVLNFRPGTQTLRIRLQPVTLSSRFKVSLSIPSSTS